MLHTPDFRILLSVFGKMNEFYLDCLDKLNYNVRRYRNFYLRKDF